VGRPPEVNLNKELHQGDYEALYAHRWNS